MEAYGKRDLTTAIVNLNAAIELLPGNSEYFAARGLIKLEDGLDTDAEPDFNQALKLYPYEMLAHYGLGMLAANRKAWDAAQKHFTEAFRADPKRAETQYQLAIVHHRKGEHSIALRVMQQAHALFVQHNDRRKADAAKWVKTLEKLAQQPPSLPLAGLADN